MDYVEKFREIAHVFGVIIYKTLQQIIKSDNMLFENCL